MYTYYLRTTNSYMEEHTEYEVPVVSQLILLQHERVFTEDQFKEMVNDVQWFEGYNKKLIRHDPERVATLLCEKYGFTRMVGYDL